MPLYYYYSIISIQYGSMQYNSIQYFSAPFKTLQGSAKLEKAEILKMTVDHLKLLQTSQKVNSSIPEHSILASDLKREGYRECVSEVARYMMTFEGLDPQNPLLVRLLGHLHQLQNSQQLHSSLTSPSVKSQLPINNTSAFSQVFFFWLNICSIIYYAFLINVHKIFLI